MGPRVTNGAVQGGMGPRASWASVLVLVLAALPRLWAALRDKGVFCPEEIYEALEPAHRFAFGWGLTSPEYRARAHSRLLSNALGVVWRIAAELGVHGSPRLLEIAKVAMACLSLASVWLAMSLARRLKGERAAVLTGLLAVGCAPLVVFGSRPFVETASAPLVVGAALLLETRVARRSLYAGALLGLASALCFETLTVAVGLVALLALRGRRLDAGRCASVVVGFLVAGGLFDWGTLGAPFQSARTALQTSLLRARPWTYPRADLLYFPHNLSTSMGVSLSVMVFGLVVALVMQRSRGLVLVVVVALVLLMGLPNPALRAVMPLLPLALALAAVGLTRLFDGLRAGPWPSALVGLACAAQMGWITQAPSRAQLGFGTSDLNAWHSGEEYFQTTWVASSMPDLCGVIFAANDPVWTGGYTYLHRSVPMYFDERSEHLDAANAVVGAVTERLPAPWKRTYASGLSALWQRPGGCSPTPPGWSMSLP